MSIWDIRNSADFEAGPVLWQSTSQSGNWAQKQPSVIQGAKFESMVWRKWNGHTVRKCLIVLEKWGEMCPENIVLSSGFSVSILRKKTDKASLPKGESFWGWVGPCHFDVYIILLMCAFTGFCNRWKGWNCGALGWYVWKMLEDLRH